MIKDIRNCSVKNIFSVGLPTANPPNTHRTRSVPIYGTADSKFVITVAPQNDIYLHGNIYPMKAVVIVTNRITTPIDHVCTSLCEP
jgi:hypothetical protein